METIQRSLESTPVASILPAVNSPVWKHKRFNDYFKPLVDLALLECDQTLPRIPDSLYEIFHRTGNRSQFEVEYFERRRRIARAVIAYLRAGSNSDSYKRLEDSIIDKLSKLSEDDS
ncbi:MAG: hypothetical protein ACQKBW_06195, partial [Puniceicoccales bacterium]